MSDQGQVADTSFTQEVPPECHHLCLIYDDEAQRRKIVSDYLAAGMKRGEIVRYFADTTSPDDVRAWLVEKGIALQEGGSFGILTAESAYCPSGRFVPREVLDNMVARYAMAREAGYSGSRVAGEMTWALRGIPGSDRLLEYEIGINLVHDTFPHVGMCQYDARLFDGALLFKVLQIHPFMIAQGQIVRNPFYLRPEEFLATYRTDA